MYNTIQSRSVLRVPHALSLKISIDRYTPADSFTDTFLFYRAFLLVLLLVQLFFFLTVMQPGRKRM